MNRQCDKQYPEKEFPWNFYFNGVLMPKWSACWALAGVTEFLKPEESWDADVGDRDIYIVSCRIDHVGVSESAEPDRFVYAVQGVLCILLEHRQKVMGALRTGTQASHADEVYRGLISGALQMRKLASEHQMAFWISGYEEDRLRLVRCMERAQLPPSHPDHEAAPHLRQAREDLTRRINNQRTKLHRLAQAGEVEKAFR